MLTDDDGLIPVSRDVLRHIWIKARNLYIEACRRDGHDPGPPDECWAEFEHLLEYADLTGGVDDLRSVNGPKRPPQLFV